MLQRHVEILADVIVLGDGREQAPCDAVGVGIEEAQPAQAFNPRERVEQQGEAVLDAEIFAVAGGVLADEGEFADAGGYKLAGFGDHGIKSSRAKLAAQVGNDAEAARMVAALGDFDVGRGARG